MRVAGVMVVLLLCCGLLLAQSAPPQEAHPSQNSRQANASQDSSEAKPSQNSGASGEQRRGGERGFQRGQGVVGTITAINGNSVTIKSFEGKTATVNVTPQTTLRKDQQQAKLADFKVGDMVFVRGEPAGENTWNAAMMGSRSEATRRFHEGMGKQFIVGEIKSIDGRNLTIARVDGVTQSITVDENTSFRKNGESVTLGDFAPGEHVFVRGEMKNGVFVPSLLNAGERGRMGGGMMGGPMGRPAGPPPGEGPAKEGPNPQQ